MSRIPLALPALLAITVGGFLLWGLDPDRDPNAVPSARIAQPVPDFVLPAVEGTGRPGLSAADLRGGDAPVLVNVFASWCVPCRAEHAVLTRLVRNEGVRLMGLNYQDEPADAARWLDDLGNPYARIGSDIDGRVGIDWAISGVPETFVVDADGVVTFRYVGPIIAPGAQEEIREALAAAAVRS
ncbi:DsbE family thiol:disulfide interchange protein [Jannaschia sp. M317]|uniref:DsbE family thiol:disulfide interchange protein n=1 Tax=Jannaschia sp. M317 TaxID=2867011 RepID=UPI0021A53C6B|nr:DsbE family thiol:disulfide interchange protein [Jannaschia sp. M317]UWQ19761.1 DsbE family thiol:disulfide interchange protein [Jannaschia sp. M317]